MRHRCEHVRPAAGAERAQFWRCGRAPDVERTGHSCNGQGKGTHSSSMTHGHYHARTSAPPPSPAHTHTHASCRATRSGDTRVTCESSNLYHNPLSRFLAYDT